MAKKEKPSDTNTNSNVNNITTNVHVNLPKRKSSTSKSRKGKSTPNWYTKAIIGGIIALILSLIGYYIKNNLDSKGKDHPTTIHQN